MAKLYFPQLIRLWLGMVLLMGVISYPSTCLRAQSVTQLTNTAGNPAPVVSNPMNFAVFNGRLYFLADSPVSSAYKVVASTDGTPAGTKMLSGISVYAPNEYPVDFTVYNGRLYFVAGADREVYVTDGTDGGTGVFKDLYPGAVSGNPAQLTATGGKLYFVAVNWPHDSNRVLWVSDGTPAGTQPLADAIGVAVGGSEPAELTAVGDRLFYRASADGQPGLWVTDGTATGTRLVKGGPTSPGSPFPVFTNIPRSFSKLTNEKLIFRAAADGTEDEPWISNGTSEGTFSPDIVPYPYGSFPNIIPGSPTFNDRFYFEVQTGTQKGLYATDGNIGGTHLIKPSLSNISNLTVFNGKLYFTTSGGLLWETDGSETGTQPLAGAPAGARNLTVANGKLYFTVPAGSGDALWGSDGTTAGTRRLIDYTGILDNRVKSLTAFNDQLYLTALSLGLSTPELFRLNANQAPIAPVIANTTGTVGQYFNQTIPSFTDPDGFILTYELTGLPPNLIFSGGSGGIVGGMPVVAGVFLVTVTARDLGGLSASTTYTLTINPAPSPISALHLLAPTYDCVTGVIEFHTSGGDGSLIRYVAPGISRGVPTNTVGVVEYELRQDPKPILLQAIQNGVTVNYTFDLPGICGGGSLPPSDGSFHLLPPTYNCVTGVIEFHTSGGDGSLIRYVAPGISRGTDTDAVGVVEYELRQDPKPILLQAIQNGITVSYTFDLPGSCGSARVAATGEPAASISVNVLGNPIVNETTEVEIRGAQGLPLTLFVNDMQGRPISDQRIEQAASTETRTIRVGKLAGIYLLRVTTPTQTRTIKLLRQ